MIFKIAWRNIGRNKRRTLITAASIFFAVLFSVFTTSLNRGIFGHMIDSSVSSYVGFVQILQKEYWEERTLDKTIELTEELHSKIMATKAVKGFVPRLESFALANHKKASKSSMVIGIDPEKENALTKLKDRVKKGEYLKNGDESVLIGDGLAAKLKLDVGDTIVLIGQGYRGANAAGKYAIKGLVHFGSPELNASVVYMPLAAAQWFYAAENLITSLVLDLDDKKFCNQVVASLNQRLDTANTYEIKSWEQMIPDLVEMKEMKEGSNFLMVLILYFIVSFGIFGTILMMTKERQYEFGVLLSIGMARKKLAFATWIETIMLGLLGAVFGILISYALMYYLMVNPIQVTGDLAKTYEQFGIEAVLPTSTDWDIFYTQALIVLIVTGVLALYPCFKIWKMKPIDSMRG